MRRKKNEILKFFFNFFVCILEICLTDTHTKQIISFHLMNMMNLFSQSHVFPFQCSDTNIHIKMKSSLTYLLRWFPTSWMFTLFLYSRRYMHTSFEPPPLCWPSCTICPRKTHLARNRICFLFSTLMTLQMFLGTLPKVTPLNSKYLPWRWSWAGALTRQANLS